MWESRSEKLMYFWVVAMEKVKKKKNTSQILALFKKQSPQYLLMEWMWEMKEREKSRMARATGVVGVPFIEGEAIGRRDLGE